MKHKVRKSNWCLTDVEEARKEEVRPFFKQAEKTPELLKDWQFQI